MAEKTSSEALLGGMQEGLKPFEIDPDTNRKTIFPDRFTLLDAQRHYNETHEGNITAFNPKGGLKKFKDITIENIATNSKDFIKSIMMQVRLAGGSAEAIERKQRSAFANLRLVIGNSTPLLPDSFDNLATSLPSSNPDHPKTIDFFEGNESRYTKSSATYAIRDQDEIIRSWFEGLENHATDNAVDIPVVEAIKLGVNTGFRPSLITNLSREKVSVLEDGTTMLMFRSTDEGVKESKSKGGGLKFGKFWRIPLNKEAGDIVRERLQVLKSLGLEGKTDKLFFLNDPSKNSTTPLTTTHMNRVLGEVKLFNAEGEPEGIIEDLDSLDPDKNRGIRYNSLHIAKDDRAKSGSQLLRNMHTHLAHKAGIDPSITDYLQGRVSEQSIGVKLNYLQHASDAVPANNILEGLSKWGTYFNRIGVAQKDYQPGAIGTNQIGDNISENAQKVSLQVSAQADNRSIDNQKAVIAKKQEVQKYVQDTYGIEDRKYLEAISNVYSSMPLFENIENFNNNLEKPFNFTSPSELKELYSEYTKRTKPTSRLSELTDLAAQEQEAIKQSTALPDWMNTGLKYDADGLPILSDEELTSIGEKMAKRGEESYSKNLILRPRGAAFSTETDKNIEAEIAPSDVAAKPNFFSDEEVSKRQDELFDQVTDLFNPNPFSKLKLGVKIAKTVGKAFKATPPKATPPKAKPPKIEPPKDIKKKKP